MRQKQQTYRCLTLLVAATLGLAWACDVRAADAPVPAVMDLIPASNQLVVVIPDLSRLSQKLALLNDSMGLNMPGMNDALGELKRFTGISGLKNDGSAAVVSINEPQGATGDESQAPAMLLFLPVEDYSAFVTALKGQATEQVTQITFASGHEAYARQASGFAVLSPRRSLVARFTPAHGGADLAQKIGRAGVDCLTKSEVSLVVDMAAAASTLQPQLEAMVTQGLAQSANAPNASPLSQSISKAMLSIYHDAAIAVLRDTSSLVLGLDVDELGLGVTCAAQLKPGSPLSILFTPGSADRTLALLPQQPYLIASAVDLHAVKVPPLLADIQDELTKQQLPWMADLVKGIGPLYDNAAGIGQVFYPPPGGLASASLTTLTVVNTTNGPAFVDAFKAYLQLLNTTKFDLSGLAGPSTDPNAPPAIVTFSNQFTANAFQVDGVNINQYEIRCDIPPQMVSQLGSAGAMLALNLASQRGYLVTMDKAVVMTSTTDRQLLSNAIAAVRAGPGLDASVKQVRDHLPPNACAEVYFHMGSLAQTLVAFMTAMNNGQPPALQVPQDLPPVGWALGFQEGSAVKRLFIPMPVVKFARDAFRALEAGPAVQQPPVNHPQPGASPGASPNGTVPGVE